MQINFFENLSARKLLLLLIFTNLFLIGLALFFYNSRFDLINYPFSYAGDVLTQDGFKNAISSRIYSLDMLISGLIMFLLVKFHTKTPKIYLMALSLVGGIGFLIASFAPDDTRHIFHVAGSAMVVASFWFMAMVQLFNIKDKIKGSVFVGMHLILQIPILAYAFTYFLNIDPLSYQLQKLAFLALAIVLIFSVNGKYLIKKKIQLKT